MTETETGNHYQIASDVAQYTFNDLHPFYRYTFIVAALTIGRGPYSEIISLQMPQDGMIHNVLCINLHIFNIMWTIKFCFLGLIILHTQDFNFCCYDVVI